MSLITKLDPNDRRDSFDMGEGLAFTPLAVANGKRNGPRELLLRTKKDFPNNLTIQLHSLVSKVCFEDNRAVGVEVYEGQHLYRAIPRRALRKLADSFTKREVQRVAEVSAPVHSTLRKY